MIFKFPFPNFNLTTTICTFSNTKTPLALYVVFRNVRSEGKRIFFVDLSYTNQDKSIVRAPVRGRFGRRSRLVKVDFAFSFIKTKFKSPYNYEESPYVAVRVFSPHLSFMKMSISCTCLLKSIVSV